MRSGRRLLAGPRGTGGRTGWFTSFREANGIEAREVAGILQGID